MYNINNTFNVKEEKIYINTSTIGEKIKALWICTLFYL